MKLPKASYRAGDRVFAILPQPDVALLLSCDAPSSWTALVFDFSTKKAVASAHNQPSLAEAQAFAIAKVREHYRVTPPEGSVQWQNAINRADILQT